MSDTAPTGAPLPGPGDVLAGMPASQAAISSNGVAHLATPSRGFVGRWMCLARPRLLVLSVAPAAATLALLWTDGTHLLVAPAILSLLAVALVQSGANLLDEYLEFERSQRAGPSLEVLGGDEAGALLAVSGIAPLNVLRGGIGLLAVGALAGIPLIVSGGVGVALLGFFGLGVAFLYSSTTYALKRLPGGEVVVFLALGPGVTVAVALAQRAPASGPVLLIGCALGLVTLALIVAVRLSGAQHDERMGWRTLVRYLGLRGSRLLYGLCLAGAFALVAALAVPQGAPHGALAVLLALPAGLIALTGMLRARSTAARALVSLQTLRVYALFALWLVVGLLASGIVARIIAVALGSGT